jgi:methylmalonyl-CoA mutase C-terminal domain/subunit
VAVPSVVARLRGHKALVAKLGMDAHWRGAIVVANALRQAGMEVVYLGHADPEAIARAAIQEDALLIGLSTLSGNHMSEVPAVLRALDAAEATDVVVVVGGTVSEPDAETLKGVGVDEVFATGSSLDAIVERVAQLVNRSAARRRAAFD